VSLSNVTPYEGSDLTCQEDSTALVATAAKGCDFSLTCGSTIQKKAKSEKVLDVAEQMCMIMRGHYVIWFGHMILINGRMVEGLS
jgi:hypothetical protein